MASPNETAALRHVLETAQANKHRLGRLMGVSGEYSETLLRGLHRKGWLALGHAPAGSKYDVYKLTPGGADALLNVLGSLRQKESTKAQRAALNVERLDERVAKCKALMEQQELMPHEPAGERR